MAVEAVRRIDALFDIERGINGKTADERRVIRQSLGAPIVADLHAWMIAKRAEFSCGAKTAEAMDYAQALERLVRFLDHGRNCITNNAPNALSAASPLFASHG